MATRTSCPSCGATVPVKAEWCSQCYFKVGAQEEAVDQGAAAAALGSREYLRPTQYSGPPLPTRYSRWASSQVSFGPVGRVLITLFLVVLPMAWGLGYSWTFMFIWGIFVAPLLLRSIWKKVAIHEDRGPN